MQKQTTELESYPIHFHSDFSMTTGTVLSQNNRFSWPDILFFTNLFSVITAGKHFMECDNVECDNLQTRMGLYI